MRKTTTTITFALVVLGTTAMAQTGDLESRIDELEAAVDLLQDRIERLEQQQAPRRISEEEAEAILRKKKVSEACTEELGPSPEFAPVLGTKVNTEYISYLKRHRACMRDRGVDY
jgi:uncharacterized small protein (DUF1192 family)